MSNRHANQTHYPTDLQKAAGLMEELGENTPDVIGSFMAMHGAAGKSGALDAKTKELMALAISVVIRCQGCIGFHTHDAIQAGASKEEIMEALGVAIVMGGGPAVMYATHALEAYEQFTETRCEASVG